jgi:quinolinate synthase
VNTYADVKAESDVCCTSSNAAAVVESLGADTVLFVPDEYLARNVARQTGRRIVVTGRGDDDRGVPAGGPVLIGWRGRCEVHELFTVDDVRAVRAQFPDVAVLAHPECSPDVVEASDFSGSTTAMIEEVRRTAAPRVLLLTECSMGDNIVASAPGKELLRLCSHRCPHMGQITLEDTLEALRTGRHAIEVPAGIRERARGAVERMIAVGAVGQRD